MLRFFILFWPVLLPLVVYIVWRLNGLRLKRLGRWSERPHPVFKWTLISMVIIAGVMLVYFFFSFSKQQDSYYPFRPNTPYQSDEVAP